MLHITHLCPRQAHAFFIALPSPRLQPANLVDAVDRKEESTPTAAQMGKHNKGEQNLTRSFAFLILNSFFIFFVHVQCCHVEFLLLKMRGVGVHRCVRISMCQV